MTQITTHEQVPALTGNRLRQFTRLVLLILWSLIMPMVFFLSKLIPWFDSQRLPRVYHWGVCKLIGLRVQFKGNLSSHIPTLFVSNHVSYLDIFALGQKLPGSFVAKSEVASWPVLNKLAKLQDTLFIERKANRAKQQLQLFQQHLSTQRNLILFPEGTSTNGAEVKPFKSSLFAAAETDELSVQVQAVTIVYTHYDGRGMNQSERNNFAWYADMPFAAHFFNVLSLRNFTAVVQFHPPMMVSDFAHRKACAEQAEQQVRASLEQELSDSGSVL